MPEWPKFREETPRKGSGIAEKYRIAAPQQYATALHQKQVICFVRTG
jgi:hypothetical protein